MMENGLAYDYCAAVLLLMIIVWYFHEKRIPLASHRTFLIMLTAVFASTGLEIVSIRFADLYESADTTMFWVYSTLQHLALNALPLLFVYYVLQVSHIELAHDWRIKAFLIICGVVDVGLIATNPITHFVYAWDGNHYIYDYGVLILTLIACADIIVCAIKGIGHANHAVFSRLTVILLNVLFVAVALFLQLQTQALVLNFVLTMISLTMYIYLQNPKIVIDEVTGQFNRRFMGEFIQNHFANKKPFAIVLVAMDDFKFINKTYGVENGDNLLKQVGTFMEQMEYQKTVFRLGADQFCIVISKEMEKLDAIAKKVNERFKHPWYSENQVSIMMSASICCLECPQDAPNYGRLIEVMDYAMSMTKKLHKGTIMWAKDMDLGKIQEDKAVEKAVKQALDRDELMVYYQPIFSINKGVYNSAEALVRLHDEELGWISPEVFIPIAERNGMILEMGEVILEKVCRFIHDFRLSETTVEYIEVNISPVQLMQLNFSDRVMEIMKRYDVKPSQINIEITETATVSAADTVNENISNLVERGIQFSLDDYGSGYANIDYINHMPFSIIKLDKCIIWDSFKSEKAGITLEHTIAMLNALKLHIVAEGVETAEMRDCLVSFGCHFMQGWYYSKAVSDQEFMKLIEAQAQ